MTNPQIRISLCSDRHLNDMVDGEQVRSAAQIVVDRYWSGEAAPSHRMFDVQLLWSDTALYVRYDACQSEPLIVNENPDITKRTDGLWDRDVCEIFVAPDPSRPNRYFEFEVAPTGEWVDVEMEIVNGKRRPRPGYSSRMECSARIEEDRVVMAMRIPWDAFGKRPKAGDVWLGNIFRCVGSGEGRGYLAWRPTETLRPNFHVPEKFGEFHFVE